MSVQIYIAGIGVITPVGENVDMTLAAIDAGISRYQASGFINSRGHPMVLSTLPEGAFGELSQDLLTGRMTNRVKRLIQVGVPALQEVMTHYKGDKPIPLFLAGPELLPDHPGAITGEWLKLLVAAGDVPIDITRSRYFGSGRCGVFEAIELAYTYFAQTQEDYVLVGGVDTYIDPATLGYLDVQGRVHAQAGSNAFVPAEGAGFLLLHRLPTSQTLPAGYIPLHHPGFSLEPGHIYSDDVYRGEGLAEAVTAALQQTPALTISTIYSTMNGENFFAKEFAVAAIRLGPKLAPDFRHVHPIDTFGDMGAATAVVLIALAIRDLLQNRSTGALIYASSDLGGRAAMCIGRNA